MTLGDFIHYYVWLEAALLTLAALKMLALVELR